MLFFILSIFVISYLLGVSLIPQVVHLARKLRLYDQPDARKVHTKPIPRIGGIIFLPVSIVAFSIVVVAFSRYAPICKDFLWSTMLTQHLLAYLSGAVLIYIMGLFDDLYTANYKLKFMAQFIAASLLCISGLWLANLQHLFFIDEIPFWIGMPLSIVFIIFVTNAMNLIDGIDGLSSGISIIALVVIAMLNYLADDLIWTFISIAYLGVLCSFFGFNVFGHKHKLFMGDTGSLTLGFTFAFLIIHFWQRNPIWNPYFHNAGIVAVSPLFIPMFDVIRVFLYRISKGHSPFLPDKNHIHHLLLKITSSSKATLAIILAITLLIVTVNYILAAYLSQTSMVIGDIFIYIAIIYIIKWAIKCKESN